MSGLHTIDGNPGQGQSTSTVADAPSREIDNIVRTSAMAALDAELNGGSSFVDALIAAAQHVALTSDHGFELHSDGNLARIVHLPAVPSRATTEAYFVAIALRLRCIAGLTTPLVAVRFAHPAPEAGADAPFDMVFGVPVEFGAAKNELVFPASVLAMRLGGGQADAPLALPAPAPVDALVHRVREEIARMLFEQGGPVRLGPLARRFAMSTRSLQRRLGERGTSLSALVEDVRRERATELLSTDRVALADIARELRFASVPAFCRAFRHWTKMSPRAYQRSLARRPSGIFTRGDLPSFAEDPIVRGEHAA